MLANGVPRRETQILNWVFWVIRTQNDKKSQSLTKSNAEPPPKYSIMIHNFVPWNSGDRERRE